jgi:hypothetical protein
MDVLILGYGKIGRIKSFIWHSLGRRVIIYDVDTQKQGQAKADGFDVYDQSMALGDDLIVDISTPASCHLESLRWTFEHVQSLPRSILIEKPLASDEAELKSINALLDQKLGINLKNMVAINESYYFSSALQLVAEHIRDHESTILSIRSELSKNRLDDVMAGRFVDQALGSLGIELPHMIAMVQVLGLSVKDLVIQDAVMYRDPAIEHNEGFTVAFMSGPQEIEMSSYLGRFRLENGRIAPNDAITRTLVVETDRFKYTVTFDPVSGLDRYKAKVAIRNVATMARKEIILEDDHLSRHLKKIHGNHTVSVLDQLTSIDNSTEVSRLIFGLKRVTEYTDISRLDLDKDSTPRKLKKPFQERVAYEYN